MQMTMMATPNINKELLYLNKEDRLLRWLLIKHRDTKYGMDFLNEEHDRNSQEKYSERSLFEQRESDAEDDEEDDDEYNVDEEGKEA